MMSENICFQLGPNWVAIVQEDGSVLLQYHKQVLAKSGFVIDLTEDHDPASHALLEDRGCDDLYVRTLELGIDGEVAIDPNALSPSGVITPHSFHVIPDAHRSFGIVSKSWARRKAGDGRR